VAAAPAPIRDRVEAPKPLDAAPPSHPSLAVHATRLQRIGILILGDQEAGPTGQPLERSLRR
jgi:hypothetical protein